MINDTNLGIRKEDLFNIIIFKSQNITDYYRSKIDTKGRESRGMDDIGDIKEDPVYGPKF